MCRDPTTVRQPGYLSLGEVHGLCAPASRRVCLYRGAEAPERTPTILLTRRRVIYMPHGHLSLARWAICMPGGYSLQSNFGELPFRNCLENRDGPLTGGSEGTREASKRSRSAASCRPRSAFERP